MSRRSKGARLYLREGRRDSRTGAILPPIYFIRDGQKQVSTGCGPDRLEEAEKQLQAYLGLKWSPKPLTAAQAADPEYVLIADVLELYAAERAPKIATNPHSTAGFIKNLLAWWGTDSVSKIRRSSCQAYVAHRTGQRFANAKHTDRLVSEQTARRELEVLSSAVGYWDAEHKLTARPKVWLPEKPHSPRDALSRSQAAELLLAAMGWRKDPKGAWKRLSASAVKNRAHLRRFILMGLYTGTRHSVMTKLLWTPATHKAWADLDKGIIYRRGSGERDHSTKRRPLVKLPPRLLAHMTRWKRLDELNPAKPQSVIHHGGDALAGKIRTGFEGCVRDAGLPSEITPHWMRHTAATWLMEAGVDSWAAAGYLGMTANTLEKHYGHHRPDHQSIARHAIARQKQVKMASNLASRVPAEG